MTIPTRSELLCSQTIFSSFEKIELNKITDKKCCKTKNNSKSLPVLKNNRTFDTSTEKVICYCNSVQKNSILPTSAFKAVKTKASQSNIQKQTTNISFPTDNV